MSKLAKILVTVGVAFLFFIIAIPITAGIKSSGSSPTFINLILLMGVIGGIKAIWKSEKKDNDNDNDTSVLQK